MLILILALPVLLFVIIALMLVVAYNNLVTLKNSAAAAWHQIDVQLTRRADLVANLVETVKGYAAHERAVLAEVTSARSAVSASRSAGEAGKATSALSSALSRLFALAENYPTLKADTGFLSLQNQLRELEIGLAAARESYNEAVRRYNIACERLPASIFAAAFGFTPREYFEVAEAKTAPPTVDFS